MNLKWIRCSVFLNSARCQDKQTASRELKLLGHTAEMTGPHVRTPDLPEEGAPKHSTENLQERKPGCGVKAFKGRALGAGCCKPVRDDVFEVFIFCRNLQ
jgi:hypothetical protein